MPEYLAPGVYVEETSFRSKSIEGVGTSTAGFVGLTARGPLSSGTTGITPPLLTGIADFERIYGAANDLRLGSTTVPNYLAHAVRAFFENGGGRLYVARVAATGATFATSGGLVSGAGADEQVTLSARFPGGGTMPGTSDVNLRARLQQVELATTKRLAARQQPGTLVRVGTDYFVLGTTPMETTAADATGWTNLADDGAVSIVTLSVAVDDPTGTTLEYDGLGFHPRHPRYARLVLGGTPPRAADALTNPIRLAIGDGVNAFELRSALMGAATQRTIELRGGTDGTGAPGIGDYTGALDRLLALEDIAIVAAPGSTAFDGIAGRRQPALITHAETRRAYRIAVLDTPPSSSSPAVRDAARARSIRTYAALYYPWVDRRQPARRGRHDAMPREIALPPSGFVCRHLRAQRHRARRVQGAGQRGRCAARCASSATSTSASRRCSTRSASTACASCRAAATASGARARRSSDPEWKYVNVRRYFIYLEASIDRGTQWAVFEPNGERLWANIRRPSRTSSTTSGATARCSATTPKKAFFVRCDRTTMTQNDLDNGRLICLIGVAPLKPAEFVIFRIGQKTADARADISQRRISHGRPRQPLRRLQLHGRLRRHGRRARSAASPTSPGSAPRSTVAEYRNGNDKENHVRKVPGLHKVGDVTLKRGIVSPEDSVRLDRRRPHQSGP